MNRFDVFESILRDLGTPIEPGMKVVDFGCGDGEMVSTALAKGVDAYGCDFDVGASELFLRAHSTWDEMNAARRILTIQAAPVYRLPFDDQSIDVIVSDQVFEHVQNYSEVLAEFARIMKPTGTCLHIFPARFRLIEAHIGVPLATVFRAKWWLLFWAALGVRNQYQRSLSTLEVAKQNAEWLPVNTNYLPASELRRHFKSKFATVKFVERNFLKYSRRARIAPSWLYSTFWCRCLYGTRPLNV